MSTKSGIERACTAKTKIRENYFSDTFRERINLGGISKNYDIVRITLPFSSAKEEELRRMFGIEKSDLQAFYKAFEERVLAYRVLNKDIHKNFPEEASKNIIKHLYVDKDNPEKEGDEAVYYFVTDVVEPLVGSAFITETETTLLDIFQITARLTQNIKLFVETGIHFGAFDLDSIYLKESEGKQFLLLGSLLFASVDGEEAVNYPDCIPKTACKEKIKEGKQNLESDIYAIFSMLWSVLSGKSYRDAPDFGVYPKYASDDMREYLEKGLSAEDDVALRWLHNKTHDYIKRIKRGEIENTVIKLAPAELYEVAEDRDNAALESEDAGIPFLEGELVFEDTLIALDNGKVKRQSEIEAERKAEEEARIKAEEEARVKAEAERKAEEERIAAEKRAEEERRKAEEARIKAEEEARAKAEAERKAEEERIAAEKRAEEERRKAEEEARIKAEEEARAKAEAERKAEEERRKAEEEARIKAEEEARAKAEAERKAEEERIAAEKRAEEERRKAEEAARIKAEEEARAKAEAERKAEEERIAAEKRAEEERRKAEEEARIKAEEEARAKAEAERKAEEERIAAEKRAEEERRKAEEEARIKAEEEARVKAEAERKAKEAAERKRIEYEKKVMEEKLLAEEKRQEAEEIIRKAQQKAEEEKLASAIAAAKEEQRLAEKEASEKKAAAIAAEREAKRAAEKEEAERKASELASKKAQQKKERDQEKENKKKELERIKAEKKQEKKNLKEKFEKEQLEKEEKKQEVRAEKARKRAIKRTENKEKAFVFAIFLLIVLSFAGSIAFFSNGHIKPVTSEETNVAEETESDIAVLPIEPQENENETDSATQDQADNTEDASSNETNVSKNEVKKGTTLVKEPEKKDETPVTKTASADPATPTENEKVASEPVVASKTEGKVPETKAEPEKAASFSVSPSSVSLSVGEKVQLKPSDTCTWSSSDASVAYVKNNCVNAEEKGECTITARNTATGEIAKISVKVL